MNNVHRIIDEHKYKKKNKVKDEKNKRNDHK